MVIKCIVAILLCFILHLIKIPTMKNSKKKGKLHGEQD